MCAHVHVGSSVDARRTSNATKAVLNAAINPLCAATGLRLGEMAREPTMSDLQVRASGMAVTSEEVVS